MLKWYEYEDLVNDLASRVMNGEDLGTVLDETMKRGLGIKSRRALREDVRKAKLIGGGWKVRR